MSTQSNVITLKPKKYISKMEWLLCLLLCIAVTVLILFLMLIVIFYQGPVHEDLYDKGAVRFVLGMNNLFHYGGILAEFFGYHRWLVRQGWLDYVSAAVKLPLEDGIQEKRETFAGVNVHIFEPKEKSSTPLPGLIYFHGGGFTVGSSDLCRGLCDVLAKRLRMVVVSVNYRLAPEHPYPAGFDDSFCVVKYVGENAEKLGVDASNIGVAGDSAGGALAAAVALKLRDTSSQVRLKYQVMLYPYIQGLTVDLPSHNMNELYTGCGTKKASMADYTTMYIGADRKLSKYILAGNHTSPEIWKNFGHLVDPRLLPSQYIPDDYNMEQFTANKLESKDHGISNESMKILTDPYAFPLMADSLKNLPPAFVLLSNLDPLRDEGLLYVQRLRKDVNEVEHYVDKHGLHCTIMLCKGPRPSQAGLEALDVLVTFIEKQIENN